VFPVRYGLNYYILFRQIQKSPYHSTLYSLAIKSVVKQPTKRNTFHLSVGFVHDFNLLRLPKRRILSLCEEQEYMAL
jgi:hypothetical protein